MRKIWTDGRHNLGKNGTQGHTATSVYNDTTEIRNTLTGVLVTKKNILQKRKIACHEWEPKDKIVQKAKSVTYTALQARQKANKKN